MGVSRYPYHIAIIPDGNRRFAKRLMLQPWKGHEWGAEKLKKVLDWCKKTDTKMITFYSLSLENIERRPKKEINYIYDIFRKELKDIIVNEDNYTHKNKARISCFGNFEVLPDDIVDLINGVEKRTKGYNNYYLNLAIAYGGKQEITDTVRKIAGKVYRGEISARDIDEKEIINNLHTNGFPDPDMIIRTGGEKRMSNFLPLQSAYSELFFIDTLWPEMTEKEFRKAVKEYSERKRRFGA
ncbi:MAG: di-trans,poly-cis-decaprenylcistransferase [Candidatus Aenigmarchaeota archaeon]|nr:di-trans,poly-cis-decaprenylcistransferase [Candidatus Aenigmarchaeota archaeon]